MFKKFMAIMLILAMVLSMAACAKPATEEATGDAPAADAPAEAAPFKIGILTGTVAQNEEEYRAAENVKAKYGEDRVVTMTYPVKFMDEQETTIANLVSMASDPDVKALIICQAVPGTSAAIAKVREIRPEMLVIAGVPGEDPKMISEKADIVLQLDELGMGTAVPEQAKAQGAKVFVHYSFPRHMSYALLSARRDIMKDTCAEIGLEFVDASAPDPTGDAGVAGAQQFILEDVPRMVEKIWKRYCVLQYKLFYASSINYIFT